MAEFVGDAGVDGLGGGEIGVGSAVVALLPLGEATAVKRVCNLRVDLQSRREIVDRVLEFTELEVAEATAVESVGVVRFQPERRLAVRKPLPRTAENALGQAPRIERVSVVGMGADGLVIVG